MGTQTVTVSTRWPLLKSRNSVVFPKTVSKHTEPIQVVKDYLFSIQNTKLKHASGYSGRV